MSTEEPSYVDGLLDATAALKAAHDAPPRAWCLPPEPGPEITAVTDMNGRRWMREPDGWIWRTGVFQRGGTEVVHRLQWGSVFRYYGPLTDATGEQS